MGAKMKYLWIFLICVPLLAQEKQDFPNDNIGWQPVFFETGIFSLYEEGLTHGDLFFGAYYKETEQSTISWQLGIGGNWFFTNSNGQEEGFRSKLGAGVRMFNLFYVGAGLRFYNDGFEQFWKPDNISLDVSINFDEIVAGF